MVRIACCEDEKAQAEEIKTLLEEWAVSAGQECSVTLFSGAEQFLFELEEESAVPYDLVLSETETAPKPYVFLEIAGENKKLYLDDILYVEVNGHYTTIRCTEPLTAKTSFSDMLEALNAAGNSERPPFIKCHRSAAVNIAKVAAIRRDTCENFNDLVGDKIAVYISHRMSSCKFCDKIVVLDGGKIVENGNHEQLLEKQGLYASLYLAQAQHYA